MSRDPKEYKPLDTNRKPIDPKVLHKYLYAGGDPVNIIDPTGKGLIEMLVEEGEEDTAGLKAMEGTERSLVRVFECAARDIANGISPDTALTLCLFAYGF